MVIQVRFSKSPLLRACNDGDIAFLRKFIEGHRDKKYFAIVDELHWGPLHYAIYSRSYECVAFLLSTGLVDTRSRDLFGRSCLSISIDYDIPSDIVQLVLMTDPNFYFIEGDLEALRSAVAENQTRIVTTIVDTMLKLTIEYKNTYNILFRQIAHLRFETDAERSDSIAIFAKMISLEKIDESERMHRVCSLLLRNANPGNECLFKWCVERWHLKERNAHRSLVRKLLNNPDFGFDYYIIYALHSDIHHFNYPRDRDHYLKVVVKGLLKVNAAVGGVIREVMDIFLPKIDPRKFSQAFIRVLRKEYYSNRVLIVNKMTSVDWLSSMSIGDTLDIDAMQLQSAWEIERIFHALMPFSMEISADHYLQNIREDFEIDMNDIEQPLKSVLSRFCVDGEYRAKCTLQSFCRTAIRKALIRTRPKRMTHWELVESIRILELPKRFLKYSKGRNLPKRIQRFLLFNYSDYDF